MGREVVTLQIELAASPKSGPVGALQHNLEDRSPGEMMPAPFDDGALHGGSTSCRRWASAQRQRKPQSNTSP
jgi:hypothetical protein